MPLLESAWKILNENAVPATSAIILKLQQHPKTARAEFIDAEGGAIDFFSQ